MVEAFMHLVNERTGVRLELEACMLHRWRQAECAAALFPDSSAPKYGTNKLQVT